MNKVTEIFCLIDEFCSNFNQLIKEHALSHSNTSRKRHRKSRLSDSEVMTILVLFHLGGYRCLKHFYLNYVCAHMKNEFPHAVSYNRFVELEKKVAIPLCILLKTCCLGKCTGTSFVDSTPLRVCHIKREKQHKVFKDTATKGKSTMGWFYGFKLHLIINARERLLNFSLLRQMSMIEHL